MTDVDAAGPYSRARLCARLRSAALAEAEPAYRWRLVDLYLNASRVDKMLAQLKYLSDRASADSQTRAWYRYYKKEYDFGSD